MARRIVIVGGGLMGLSAAFHLRRAGSGRAGHGAGAADPGRRGLGRERGGSPRDGPRSRRAGAGAREPRALARSRPRAGSADRLSARRRAAAGARRRGLAAAPAWVAEQRADGVPVELVDAAMRRAGSRPASPWRAAAACTARWTGRRTRWPPCAPSRRRRGGSDARVDEGTGARGLVVEHGRVIAVERGRRAPPGLRRGDGGRGGVDRRAAGAARASACRSRRGRSRCC